MKSSRCTRARLASISSLAGALLLVVAAAPAGADPVGTGSASAYGATISVAGQEAVPPTPLAEATLESEDVSETLVDVPAEPLAVSGTLNADAAVHADSDIESALTVVSQEVEGPYNASGVALIEGAEVLVDAVAADVSLVTADVIRAEAVAVCRGGAVEYAANSEIINLQVAGEEIPLNAPIQDLIDAISDGLEQSGLNQVVDVQRNVITPADDGIAVDALVVTLLAAAGDPVAQVRLGHAEVSAVACGAVPACSNGVDDDDPEDELADAADPGCHTDGDAGNPDSYDPADDSEVDTDTVVAPSPVDATPATQQLPTTGGDATRTAALAGVMGAAALSVLAMRRLVG